MSNIRRISVFTDASFIAETRTAGIGVVIKENGKETAIRKIKTNPILDIVHAELTGVLCGLDVLINSTISKKYKGKIAVSFFIDNSCVYRLIQTCFLNDDELSKLAHDEFFKQTLRKIFNLMKDQRLEIEYILIRGEVKKQYEEHVKADALSKSKKTPVDKKEFARRKAQSRRDKAKHQALMNRKTD